MKGAPGFTLLETVLFLTILALLASGLLTFFPVITARLAVSGQWLPAVFHADGKLEEVMADAGNRGWDHLVTGNYPRETLDNGTRRTTVITTVSRSGDRYGCTDTAAQESDNPKCITVTVHDSTASLLAESRLLLWGAP